MFGLRLVAPCGTHRLFGNRHHPQTAGIIHLAEKLSTIFCDAFDKNRAARAPFDSPSFDRLYSALRPHETLSGQVAQLVEHATENRGVGGSTPSLAIEIKLEITTVTATRQIMMSSYFCLMTLSMTH
jgi:hypothetical protein